MFKFNYRYLLAFIALFSLEFCIALFAHDAIVRPYIGNVLVVVLLYCFLRIFLRAYRLLPLWIFLFAVAVEVSQYFHLVEMLGLAGNRFFYTIMGNSFSVVDIVCYFVGCLVIAIGQEGVRRKERRGEKEW